ncbi:MAG: hypothetical protein LBG28_07325 [Tannerella sp.]|jgi:hypothetical protein|nr:hypothetical protein [Tannerella sp.]
MEVKGVLRNAHIRSLRGEIDPQVYIKLPKETVWWVLISFLIAALVAYFGLRLWLDGFQKLFFMSPYQ